MSLHELAQTLFTDEVFSQINQHCSLDASFIIASGERKNHELYVSVTEHTEDEYDYYVEFNCFAPNEKSVNTQGQYCDSAGHLLSLLTEYCADTGINLSHSVGQHYHCNIHDVCHQKPVSLVMHLADSLVRSGYRLKSLFSLSR